jgi:hypothetical protein
MQSGAAPSQLTPACEDRRIVAVGSSIIDHGRDQCWVIS